MVYSTNDPRLESVIVKGDVIINESTNRIVTRSKSKTSFEFINFIDPDFIKNKI